MNDRYNRYNIDDDWSDDRYDADPVDRPTRRSRRKPKKKFPLGIVLVSALIVITVIGVGVGWWVLSGDNYVPNDTYATEPREITFTIEMGSTVASVAQQLEEVGLIESAFAFRTRVRLAGAEESLQAGTYQIRAGTSYDEIIEILEEGPPRRDVAVVTIPEGRSIDRMALILEEHFDFSAEEFTELAQNGAPEFAGEFPFLTGAFDDSLEGYLFPDTYEFFEDATAHEIITQMLNQFQSVWNGLGEPTGPAREMSPQELVVIASLVEMESALERERPLVSSVIYNRLAINRRLQFCSTVQFLLEGEDRQRVRLTWEQTQIPSPYNTYLNEGLPPGPISNPGRQALSAALHPADTDYIYFVLTGEDGSQTFATNEADFNRAREISLEVIGR